VSFYRGQTVYSGSQSGIVLRKQGAHGLLVRTQREKLIMAGTFPDKPIGSSVQWVQETWPLRCVTLEQLKNGGGK